MPSEEAFSSLCSSTPTWCEASQNRANSRAEPSRQLAFSYPRPVTSDRLADALWPGSDHEQDTNLQVVVSRLRKAIGAEHVETVPGGYRLEVPTGTIDIDRFRHNTERGRQLLTLGHPGKAAEAFRQALAQWRETCPTPTIEPLESRSANGHPQEMTTSEARRHDLYNALSETIGSDRADTLMAFLPSTEAASLATKSDIADLKADIHASRTDIRSELRSETSGLGDRIDAVNKRLDRLFLTLAAGLIAMIGTVFVQSIL